MALNTNIHQKNEYTARTNQPFHFQVCNTFTTSYLSVQHGHSSTVNVKLMVHELKLWILLKMTLHYNHTVEVWHFFMAITGHVECHSKQQLC